MSELPTAAIEAAVQVGIGTHDWEAYENPSAGCVAEEIEVAIRAALTAAYPHLVAQAKADGETSDGYHTFNELYEFRKLYNAALFNEWAKHRTYPVHKSWRHADGAECFGGGWFIVMAQLSAGQISNHYEARDWGLFQIPERETANLWDGHESADVASRLHDLLRARADLLEGNSTQK